jgi:hypothetical protein
MELNDAFQYKVLRAFNRPEQSFAGFVQELDMEGLLPDDPAGLWNSMAAIPPHIRYLKQDKLYTWFLNNGGLE